MPRDRLPGWLKATLPSTVKYGQIRELLRKNRMHTVCEEAACPNIGECWDSGTATFLILGDICTRKCLYCNVKTGNPLPAYADEPARIARLINEMKLKYAVITSVTRDDLPDGGAGIFAECVTRIRPSGCRVELLIPDFGNETLSLRKVADSMPYVIGHNIEACESVYQDVRPQGSYRLSLSVLRQLKAFNREQLTKSGLMLGLGETDKDIMATLEDLRGAGVDIVTIGQYLQPSRENIPVRRYYTPEEFVHYRRAALAMGFMRAESGPLVRSSYHAGKIKDIVNPPS